MANARSSDQSAYVTGALSTPPSISQQPLDLSDFEAGVYQLRFKRLDPRNEGYASETAVRSFCKGSSLSSAEINKILSTVPHQPGLFTRDEFCGVLRLIGHCQAGRAPVTELLFQPCANVARFGTMRNLPLPIEEYENPRVENAPEASSASFGRAGPSAQTEDPGRGGNSNNLQGTLDPIVRQKLERYEMFQRRQIRKRQQHHRKTFSREDRPRIQQIRQVPASDGPPRVGRLGRFLRRKPDLRSMLHWQEQMKDAVSKSFKMEKPGRPSQSPVKAGKQPMRSYPERSQRSGEPSEPPGGSSQVDAEDANPERIILKQMDATLVRQVYGSPEVESKKVSVDAVLYGDALGEWLNDERSIATQVTWIHLPANNMAWVERLMLQLGNLTDPESDAERLRDFVLRDEYWADQQNGDWTERPQAKYMTPMCQEITVDAGLNDSQPGFLYNFGLFMPYLQWEKYLVQKNTRTIIEDIEERRFDDPRRRLALSEIVQLPCDTYEKLLRYYLDFEHPLQLRRTLDQAYYTKLDTRQRDDDQVVFRYTRDVLNHLEGGPMMLMVDQCWLWVIRDDIVVTCFPERVNSEGLGKQLGEGLDDRVSTNIERWLSRLDYKGQIKTGYDLATVIIDHCASNVLSRGKNQNHEVKFIEAFQRSIGNVMDKQTKLFQNFLKDSKRMQKEYKVEREARLTRNKAEVLRSQRTQDSLLGSLLNITKETKILQEIKDVIDELTIIAYIDNEQSNIIKEFHDFPNPRKSPERHTSEDNPGSSAINRSPEHKLHRSPGQVVKAEKLLVASMERKKIIEDLYHDAEQAYKAIVDLLDLKQKHANVSEARSARRSAEEASKQAEETTQQGYSIMLFTIVTILFLPLSSLASMFSLLQIPNTTLPINITLAYILPLSSAVIGLSFLLAFHRGARAFSIAIAKICFGWIGKTSRFDKVFDPVKIESWDSKRLGELEGDDRVEGVQDPVVGEEESEESEAESENSSASEHGPEPAESIHSGSPNVPARVKRRWNAWPNRSRKVSFVRSGKEILRRPIGEDEEEMQELPVEPQYISIS